MTTADWVELSDLTEQFVTGPVAQVPLPVLQRLDVLTAQLANDAEMPEARRLAAIVLRAAVRWYLSSREMAQATDTEGAHGHA